MYSPTYLDLVADQLEADADTTTSKEARAIFIKLAMEYRQAAKASRRIEEMHKASQEVLGTPLEYRSRMVN